MSDPLSDVENKRGQMDMGVMAARVYDGAYEETGSRYRAFLVLCGFWYGMFKGSRTDGEDET